MSEYLWTEQMPETEKNPKKVKELLRRMESLLAELEQWNPIGSSHEYQTKIKGLRNGIWSIKKEGFCYGYFIQCFHASHDYFINQKELKAKQL